MAVSININNLTLCHKGCGGFAKATLPDVCKTPPGPVPIPYPNIAFSKHLKKGTKTIKVDGGNMAAHKASEFSQSIGDEPGVAKGIKSSTQMKEATWITYSLDVKLEGKNACRLTDKMFMNHGNTVCLSGFLTEWLKAARVGNVDCATLLEEIERTLNGNKDAGTAPERGVKERYYDQIYGAQGPGTQGWINHEIAFIERQAYLIKLMNAYRTWCGGGPPMPPDVFEWAYKKAPTPQQWQGPQVVPSSSIDWGKVGWGVAAVGLTALTVVAIVSPFDGPAGDIVAGSAAAGAWGRVFGTVALAGGGAA
ncbi:MAG: DUF4150 domain-containing protein [Pseudomonadota bacterium]|nr:DUF4150 domain-containing protein [Pseudomonadota bacterium]